MTSVHISDIRSFRSCRRKWAWASPLRENLEPVVPYAPFFTGRAFHAALEFFYRDGIPFDQTLDKYLTSEEASMAKIEELWDVEKANFNEQIELIRAIIIHYGMWQAQDDSKYSDRNLEFISLELPFEIPMPVPGGSFHPTITLGGRFDGVVRHKGTGQYWIWETKTTRSVDELTRSLVNDEQCGVYMYAASKILNVPIVGVLYNMVRKKAPTEPAWLKNDTISKAKSLDASSFYYKSIVQREFPDWQDDTIYSEYGETIEALKENDGKFFRRWPVYRSEYEINMLMENVYHTAMEMVNPDIATYPAPSWLNCNFCQFRSPCLAMNAGGDYGVLLRAEYQKRESAISMRPDGEPTES